MKANKLGKTVITHATPSSMALSNTGHPHHAEAHSEIGGRHHGGGGRRHGGYPYPYGGYGYPYGVSLGYPFDLSTPVIIEEITKTKKIQITPSGVKFVNNNRLHSDSTFTKETMFLDSLKGGKPMMESELKNKLGFTNFDAIKNWLLNKGLIYIF